jgi:hypothetical protein
VSSPINSRVIAANPLRINTSSTSRICIKINNFNPFRIRTYESPNLAHKTKDFNPTRINTYALRPSKTFRINTYENKGEGGLRFHPHQYRLASRKIAFYFQQFATYPFRNSLRMISMRFYPGGGGVSRSIFREQTRPNVVRGRQRVPTSTLRRHKGANAQISL